MKKTTSIILLIVIIFSILPSFSYGEEESPAAEKARKEAQAEAMYQGATPDGKSVQDQFTPQAAEDMIQNGKATIKGVGDRYLTETDSSGIAMASTFSRFLTAIPYAVSWLMTSLVTSENTREGEYSTTPSGAFTIENLVFDRIELLNANYFVYNSNRTNYGIKLSVKNWYTGTQLIAIAGSIVTLIYMAIRAGISTVASEKAKYKRMLMDWLIGFVVIFVLHFVIIFLSNISTRVIYILSEATEEANLEAEIMEGNVYKITNGKGWSVVTETVIYFALVYYQLRFLIVYIKRFFMTGFLIVIAPIITITYAIDRAGDKKSQIFNTWLKEISVNIFIQPLHALLYLVFMYSAGKIAMQAPILAIVFLTAMSRGEKIVKSMFNLRGMRSINSVGATMDPGKLGG